MDKLSKEILELTIELNKALTKLEEEGNGFSDISEIEKVFYYNNQLAEKINLQNSL